MSGYDDRYDYIYDEPEPNVFYEPRTATAPFVIAYECDGALYSHWDANGTLMRFSNRADAEEVARSEAEEHDMPHYVLGTVSISSVPKPLPVKASTRALV